MSATYYLIGPDGERVPPPPDPSWEERFNARSTVQRACRTPGCAGEYVGVPMAERVSLRNYRCPVCGSGGFLESVPFCFCFETGGGSLLVETPPIMVARAYNAGREVIRVADGKETRLCRDGSAA